VTDQPTFTNGEVWNALYRRGFDQQQRPMAEVDSVPVPDLWGELPAEEMAANEFLIKLALGRSRWLDLGCGTGSVAAALLRLAPQAQAVGIDASAVAIEHGRQRVRADPGLEGRLKLEVGDISDLSDTRVGPFDLVYALFSLQFLRPHQLARLVMAVISPALPAGGLFAGTVRSVHRSIPSSYVQPFPDDEPYTFLSNEPHERGLTYHHYSELEIMELAVRLGGKVELLREKRSMRAYDAAPVRSWWDFVIVKASGGP
jgi:SAM-dependent methyltransferase